MPDKLTTNIIVKKNNERWVMYEKRKRREEEDKNEKWNKSKRIEINARRKSSKF